MTNEAVPWGLGEYSTEKETPLRSWFTGNWQRKITIKVVTDGDLFGGKNAMLEIRKGTRVVHVPVAEALAAGMPHRAVPRELRERRRHFHNCYGPFYGCQAQIECHEADCLDSSDVPEKQPICGRCKAREVVELAEQELKDKEFCQPRFGETIDPGEIPRLKRKLARAKQQYEQLGGRP